ncbi:MAG TPA: beta-galactosidase, partial [Bryobacteraceae bacterium]|nr:beta-galactosidase [Bryobacteraceae bacterium]
RSFTVAALMGLAAAAAPAPQPEIVQAVEFPYYLYPRSLWERELVWLKNIGIHTVEFSIPWNWHQLQPGDFDFTGRTSPRRDLTGLIKLLRRLGLHAWVRPLGLISGWPSTGMPAGAPERAAWVKQIENLLATQTTSHGGPVEFVEGKWPALDVAPLPQPITMLSATDLQALARSRAAIEKAHGTLLWKDVEDELYPAGWLPVSAGDPPSLLHKGAVGLSGDERSTVAALRRSAALLRNWPALLRNLQPVALAHAAGAKLPDNIAIAELSSGAAGAVSITNRGPNEFHDDLRLYEPAAHRTVTVPNLTVPAGESLWLPLNLSLGPSGLCAECSNFSVSERLVYATAELLSVEYENGILAMEFAAPVAAEVVLQLERKPVGPYLAAGTPRDFDWDAGAFRARLPIPASKLPDHRVRIGIAIEEPENSGFFDDARRLIVGQKNTLVTSYSSAEVAARSRLRLPEGFTASAKNNAPDEIEYELSVPADAVHGDFAALTLEADGMPLGRARLQLFRPLSVRLMEAMQVHFGPQTELTPDPPSAPLDGRVGGTLELSLRNNWPSIQTYRLEAAGDGLTFFPAKTEVSIGAMEERRLSLRIFADAGVSGLRNWTLRITGAGTAPVELPMRLVLVPRNGTVAWSADLNDDGEPEFVLESSKARAVFSTRDGGRWMEFTAKESNTNFLPEQGALGASGSVSARAESDAVVFTGPGWQRTARLAGGTLTIEQTTPLPADGLAPVRQVGVEFSIERPTANRAVYKLE